MMKDLDWGLGSSGSLLAVIEAILQAILSIIEVLASLFSELNGE